MTSDSLTPDGPPPEAGAQWCPRCRNWTLREVERVVPAQTVCYPWYNGGQPFTYAAVTIWKPKRKRCAACRTALVRPVKRPKPKKGELRPGTVAMW